MENAILAPIYTHLKYTHISKNKPALVTWNILKIKNSATFLASDNLCFQSRQSHFRALRHRSD